MKSSPCLACIAVVIIALLLAACRVEVTKTVPVPTTPESTVSASIRFTARVMDGAELSAEPVLSPQHLAHAEAIPTYDDLYNVKLTLTLEGRNRVRQITTQNVGKRLALYLDDEIRSSPEILEPIDQPHIMLPLKTTKSEAERISHALTPQSARRD